MEKTKIAYFWKVYLFVFQTFESSFRLIFKTILSYFFHFSIEPTSSTWIPVILWNYDTLEFYYFNLEFNKFEQYFGIYISKYSMWVKVDSLPGNLAIDFQTKNLRKLTKISIFESEIWKIIWGKPLLLFQHPPLNKTEGGGGERILYLFILYLEIFRILIFASFSALPTPKRLLYLKPPIPNTSYIWL